LIRSWRFRTCSGSAQPVFGDVLTAALPFTPNKFNLVLTVADTTLWALGDQLVITPQTTTSLMLQIVKILTATTMLCETVGDQAMPAAGYANSSILVLSKACYGIHLRTLTGTVGVYLGTDSTVTNAGLGSAFEDLVGADRYDYIFHNGANPLHTEELWMAGGASDKVGISAEIC
jgi:hypothetical protein